MGLSYGGNGVFLTYEEAIAVRKRQFANQPVDKDELAKANRTIAHQRAMADAFGCGRPQSTPPARIGQRAAPAAYPPAPTSVAPAAVQRTPLPRGCISVDEWRRTLPASESYQPAWSERFAGLQQTWRRA